MENSSQNNGAKRLPWEKPGFKAFIVDKDLQILTASENGVGGSGGYTDESYISTRRNVNTGVETSSGSAFESNSFNDNPFTTE